MKLKFAAVLTLKAGERPLVGVNLLHVASKTTPVFGQEITLRAELKLPSCKWEESGMKEVEISVAGFSFSSVIANS